MSFLEISSQELKEKRSNNPSLVLVDVRDEYEFEDSNIGGINIPMGEVLSQTNKLKDHVEIFLCCASGKRSKTVAYHLSKLLPHITFYTLSGGITHYNTLASA